MLKLTPTWAIWSYFTQKLGEIGVASGAQETCSISEIVQNRTKVTMTD